MSKNQASMVHGARRHLCGNDRYLCGEAVQPVHHAVGLDLPGVGHLPGRLHDPGQGGGEGRPFPGLLG